MKNNVKPNCLMKPLEPKSWDLCDECPYCSDIQECTIPDLLKNYPTLRYIIYNLDEKSKKSKV